MAKATKTDTKLDLASLPPRQLVVLYDAYSAAIETLYSFINQPRSTDTSLQVDAEVILKLEAEEFMRTRGVIVQRLKAVRTVTEDIEREDIARALCDHAFQTGEGVEAAMQRLASSHALQTEQRIG